MQRLSLVTVLVPDYDAALAFYVGALGFRLAEDRAMPDGKRWVVVEPRGPGGAGLLLARAADAAQRAAVGRQAGERVFLFLQTDDFARDHAAFRTRGVAFREEPRDEDYGRVAVFTDGFGNLWDLIEPKVAGAARAGPRS